MISRTNHCRFLLRHKFIYTQKRHIRLPKILQQQKRNIFSITKKIQTLLIRQRNWTFDDTLALCSWLLLGNILFFSFDTTGYLCFFLSTLELAGCKNLINEHAKKELQERLGLQLDWKLFKTNWKQRRIEIEDLKIIRNQNPTVAHFDLAVKKFLFSISFQNWLDGKGWLDKIEVDDLQGTVDRRHMTQVYEYPPPPPDEKQYLYLQSLIISNLKLNVLSPFDFRPFPITLYRGEFGIVRYNWILMDLLHADSLVGELDQAIFILTKNEEARRFRLIGLAIDMLNAGDTGPFGWIKKGTVDFDIHFSGHQLQIPKEELLEQLKSDWITIQRQLVSDLKNEFPEIFSTQQFEILEPENDGKTDQSNLVEKEKEKTKEPEEHKEKEDKTKKEQKISIDISMRFHHILAQIPAHQKETADFPSSQYLPTLIAYLNAQPTQPRGRKTTTPPLHIQFSLPVENFHYSWNIYDCGLVESIRNEVYKELMRMLVVDYQNYKNKGLKRKNGSHKGWFWQKQEKKSDNDSDEENEEQSSEEEPETDHLQNMKQKVGWFYFQTLSKAILDRIDENAQVSHSKDGLEEVYNQVVWNSLFD